MPVSLYQYPSCAGMGRVNAAFLRTLSQPDACNPGRTVYKQLEATMQAACARAQAQTASGTSRLVLAGHSLGGATAPVLAQLLYARYVATRKAAHACISAFS